jgi:hypothetical protein
MTDPRQAKCLDKSWKYVNKDESDIRKTFVRIRRQLKEEEAAKQAEAAAKQAKRTADARSARAKEKTA